MKENSGEMFAIRHCISGLFLAKLNQEVVYSHGSVNLPDVTDLCHGLHRGQNMR
jgi:hypothetical protein